MAYIRLCWETTSCCQACESPAMHWRTSLATASCAASCSGVRSNFASKVFGGARSVPRGTGGCALCSRASGSGADRAMWRGASLRADGRPTVGIAMCKTPMNFLYAWAFSLVQYEKNYGAGSRMTPQAIRLPALPVGSVFMSSAFSWTMMEVPPLATMELGEEGSRER